MFSDTSSNFFWRYWSLMWQHEWFCTFDERILWTNHFPERILLTEELSVIDQSNTTFRGNTEECFYHHTACVLYDVCSTWCQESESFVSEKLTNGTSSLPGKSHRTWENPEVRRWEGKYYLSGCFCSCIVLLTYLLMLHVECNRDHTLTHCVVMTQSWNWRFGCRGTRRYRCVLFLDFVK